MSLSTWDPPSIQWPKHHILIFILWNAHWNICTLNTWESWRRSTIPIQESDYIHLVSPSTCTCPPVKRDAETKTNLEPLLWKDALLIKKLPEEQEKNNCWKGGHIHLCPTSYPGPQTSGTACLRERALWEILRKFCCKVEIKENLLARFDLFHSLLHPRFLEAHCSQHPVRQLSHLPFPVVQEPQVPEALSPGLQVGKRKEVALLGSK